MKSWLLEFQYNADILKDPPLADEFFETLNSLVRSLFDKLFLVSEVKDNLEENGYICLHNAPNSCSVLSQTTKKGLLTIDIHTFTTEVPISNKDVDQLRSGVFKIEGIHKQKTLNFEKIPPIERGYKFCKYDTLTTGGLVEYDFDQLVFDKDSPYQNVRILHSKEYGNCLYLDNDLNLAESDLPYTVAITGGDKENYRNKEVLILGGGDGGILNYLKNKGCKMIIMIDIDQVVIDASKVYLRGICDDAMDENEGQNYKIIVDDCVKHLVEYQKTGRKFDFVINDLTAIPISQEPVGSHWDFLRLILSLSMAVLKSDGKYFTQGNGAGNFEGLKMYEQQLEKLQTPVSFSKEVVGVPSYKELWVFYTLWKKNPKME